jgi:predicted nucleic acid-binding protein
MLAIDTNVVVRYLAGDHREQSRKARTLVDSDDIFVCTTVLLETERVLRSVYGLTSVEAATALSAFAGLQSVTLEDAPLAAKALDWVSQGMDFADALFLAKAKQCDAIATFDRSFARIASKLSAVRIHSL